MRILIAEDDAVLAVARAHAVTPTQVRIAWTLAQGYFPYAFPGLTTATYWWMGLIGAVGLFVSIILHEFSHSLVARNYGIPMRGITLFIFGGMASIARQLVRSLVPGAVTGHTAEDIVTAKVDYNLSVKHVFSGTYAWNREVVDRPTYGTDFAAAPKVTNNNPAKLMSAGWLTKSVTWSYGAPRVLVSGNCGAATT